MSEQMKQTADQRPQTADRAGRTIILRAGEELPTLTPTQSLAVAKKLRWAVAKKLNGRRTLSVWEAGQCCSVELSPSAARGLAKTLTDKP